MPSIRNLAQRNAAAQEGNFLNASNPQYEQVRRFQNQLADIAAQLGRDRDTLPLSRQIGGFAGDIMMVQVGAGPIYNEEQVGDAITRIALNMGPFLKDNYQAILDAGQSIDPPLTKEVLDANLDLIGNTMGVQLNPNAPQVQQEQQAQPPQPEAPRQPGMRYDDVNARAIAMYTMDSMEQNGPAAQALDQMLDRLNASPQKELPEVQNVLSAANQARQSSAEYLTYRQRDLGQGRPDAAGNYTTPASSAYELRNKMKALQETHPELYAQLCAPYVETMRRHDYAPEMARYAALSEVHEREFKAEQEQEKAQLRELSKPVTLYEDQVEMTENSLAYGIDTLRNKIIDSPGFREDPPQVSGRDMAELYVLLNSAGEDGPYKARGALFWDNIPSVVNQTYGESREFFDQLAREPDLLRTLQEREPGQSWFDSKLGQFSEVFEATQEKYNPNRKPENTARAKETIENACELLNDNGQDLLDGGNKAINPLYAALMTMKGTKGRSGVATNLQTGRKAMDFLASLSAEDLLNTDGAPECAEAALSAMSVTLPPEMVQKGCDLLNEKLGLGPWDKGWYAADKFAPGFKEQETALSYINNCKRGIVDDDTARTEAANIFAARIAVDTKGGKAKYLNKPLSEMQTEKIAAELNKNKNFRDWLSTLDKDKARGLLSGHGGDLEQDFRQHLLKAPPGKLENDPALRRYMPTARERIEELQRQVKEARKAKLPENELKELQAAAAAEIIAIRNACQVERKTGYGLDKPIPPAGKGEKTLAGTVETLCGDPEMKDVLIAQAQGKLLEGHGGKMMADIRKACDDISPDDEVTEIVNANTVDSRILKLEDRAEALREKLQSSNKAEREAALKESRRVLSEYVKLDGIPEEDKAKDMPWKSANAAAKSGEKNALIEKIISDPKDADTVMQAVSERDSGMFSQFLHEKKQAGILKDSDLDPEYRKRMQQQEQQKEREKETEQDDPDRDRHSYLDDSDSPLI